jgi:cation diffusion facilitator family transporter
MLANGVLAALKIVTGVIGNSYALIADGIESLNDLLGSGVVLFSLRVSAIPPDQDHPYGHGKAEQLAALFSALSLLAAGGIIAFQSAGNLIERHDSPSWFTLPVLVLVIATKELLSRYALRKGRQTSSTALRVDAWHHRSDAITSLAAFIGIAIALIGGPGYERADDAAALLACLVIGYNGIKLLRIALHENMEGAPPTDVQARVRGVASAVEGVFEIEKLRMKKIGLGYFMDIHVQVDGRMSVADGHRIGHDVQRALLEAELGVGDVVVHIEPHGHRPPSAERSREPDASTAYFV